MISYSKIVKKEEDSNQLEATFMFDMDKIVVNEASKQYIDFCQSSFSSIT